MAFRMCPLNVGRIKSTHSCHSPFSNCRLGADVRPCDTTHGMARLGLGWMSSCTRVHVSDRDFDVLRQ